MQTVKAVPGWFRIVAVIGVLLSLVIMAVNIIMIFTRMYLLDWHYVTYVRVLGYMLFFALLLLYSDRAWLRLVYAFGAAVSFLRFLLWFNLFNYEFSLVDVINLVLLLVCIVTWIYEKGVWKKAALLFGLSFLLNYVNWLDMSYLQFFIYHSILQIPIGLGFASLALSKKEA